MVIVKILDNHWKLILFGVVNVYGHIFKSLFPFSQDAEKNLIILCALNFVTVLASFGKGRRQS